MAYSSQENTQRSFSVQEQQEYVQISLSHSSDGQIPCRVEAKLKGFKEFKNRVHNKEHHAPI